VQGNAFLAPAGWSIAVRGAATIVEAPEGDSWIAFVDVNADAADAAVKAAWAAYKPGAKWPLVVATDAPPRDGWKDRRTYEYQTSPSEQREVSASAQRANGVWTVAIRDLGSAVSEKRSGQIALIFSRFLPRGYTRETFAGRRAHALDAARVAELTKFIEAGQRALKVPGAALGLIQHGKVVFSGGFGVRELGRPAKPDGNTLFMIASNTKSLTTLLLAKLVDSKRLAWDSQVSALFSKFKLGDAATTQSVLVKHLVCACTGLPRQDLEELFEFGSMTPDDLLKLLGTMKPTSKFGEMFQYSNFLAAAAGYLGGHIAYPDLEIGAAYDRAMQKYVFDPLGMGATTFDYARALRANSARPHAPGVDGTAQVIPMTLNYSAIPDRPSGAAWSSVHDLLKYVAMELAEGVLPNGRRYISKETLLARRVPQVAIGADRAYGMGLFLDSTYGTPVVYHGGDLHGFHGDMLWLPEHGVGAVLLTNGDPSALYRVFRRKLLEVSFDGEPEADATVAAAAQIYYGNLAAERKLMTVPADPAEAARLAPKYKSTALGELAVRVAATATVFDLGEWKSEMASLKNPDGSLSFVTITPGIRGLEFIVGAGPGRTLVVRDGQHEYVFDEKR